MSSSIDFLISTQNEAGGWGYSPGQRSVVESTAAVLLAIADEPLAVHAFDKGISWLLKSQHRDGGWGINEIDTESGWHTAWAIIAIKIANMVGKSLDKAVEWLTFVDTYEITTDEFKNTAFSKDGNASALVWPWLPGQGCWIEPTALAVLGLTGVSRSKIATTRMQAALEYFIQNRTPAGGWDVGNAGLYDSFIQPHAYQTALVVIALSQTEPGEILPSDLAALRLIMRQERSILSLSSGLAAINALGDSDEGIKKQIVKEQMPNGSWANNPFFTAWAMIALRGYY